MLMGMMHPRAGKFLRMVHPYRRAKGNLHCRVTVSFWEKHTRIRESIPVTAENGWVNPKSGLLEHLALKYLNFSTEEWMQMNMPVDCGIAGERERLCNGAKSELQ